MGLFEYRVLRDWKVLLFVSCVQLALTGSGLLQCSRDVRTAYRLPPAACRLLPAACCLLPAACRRLCVVARAHTACACGVWCAAFSRCVESALYHSRRSQSNVSAAQRSAAQRSAAQRSSGVLHGTARHGTASHLRGGDVWCGVVWCGVVWCGGACSDLVVRAIGAVGAGGALIPVRARSALPIVPIAQLLTAQLPHVQGTARPCPALPCPTAG